MPNCIHCDAPILRVGIRVISSAPKFIHEECYKQLCNSFFKAALTTQQAQSRDVHLLEIIQDFWNGAQTGAITSDHDETFANLLRKAHKALTKGVFMNDDVVTQAVYRFLAWQLPDDFTPDGGITYTPIDNHKPSGTNLFTARQAEAMIRHILTPFTQNK